MPFIIRKLNDAQTFGEKLKALRLAAPLTLSECAARTKIRKAFLEAFETGRFDLLPEPLYAKNYLRTYVQSLGGDPEYFLTRFEEERGTCDFVAGSQKPVQRVRKGAFLVASRVLQGALVVTVLTAVTGYIGYQLKSITSPPSITITGPVDGIATDDALVTVTGNTEPGVTLHINGSTILINQDGSFEAEVPLERGLNLITVEGSRRYSRPSTEIRRVVLEADKTTAELPTEPTLP